MEILAVNTSHDTSIVTFHDGEVTNVFEEARHRRDKHWTPSPDEAELITLSQRGLHKPDHLIFTSFDRRGLDFTFSDEVRQDRLLARDIIGAFAQTQLTRTRIEEIMEDFNVDKDNPRISVQENNIDADEIINHAIASQLEMNEYVFDLEHHLYHAECGYYFSPWYDKNEDVIAITWDGGGAQRHHSTHPNYQEIESIYYIQGKETEPKLQWQRLSNTRSLGDAKGGTFDNELESCLHCPEDLETTIEGVPTVFTSQPSMGMNFSNLSAALGCEKMGRAPGKVMGMASYAGVPIMDKVHTRHTVAQRCELDALEHSCEIIQRALDMNPDCKRIVLSGGYSLNCTNNYKYMERFPEVTFFVDPAASDAGTAVGASLNLARLLNNETGESE